MAPCSSQDGGIGTACPLSPETTKNQMKHVKQLLDAGPQAAEDTQSHNKCTTPRGRGNRLEDPPYKRTNQWMGERSRPRLQRGGAQAEPRSAQRLRSWVYRAQCWGGQSCPERDGPGGVWGVLVGLQLSSDQLECVRKLPRAQGGRPQRRSRGGRPWSSLRARYSSQSYQPQREVLWFTGYQSTQQGTAC